MKHLRRVIGVHRVAFERQAMYKRAKAMMFYAVPRSG